MNAFTKLYVVLASFEATIAERRDERGVTAVEYALLAAAIAAFIGGLTTVFKGELETAFANILP